MLVEGLQFITNLFSSNTTVREFGLLQDAIAISARHRRLKQQWSEHLANSKMAIQTFCDSLEHKETVVILGAGLINDLPLNYLSKNFGEVILIDIVFLLETDLQCKKYPNVKCLKMDITACLKDSLLLLKTKKLNTELIRELNQLAASPINLNLEANTCLISLNLLSQLPWSLKKYLHKKYPQFSEQEYQVIFQTIIQNHLSFLKHINLNTLLITDYQKNLYDKAGNLIESESSLEGLELKELVSAKPFKSWTWELAPYGEIEKDYKLCLDLLACRI